MLAFFPSVCLSHTHHARMFWYDVMYWFKRALYLIGEASRVNNLPDLASTVCCTDFQDRKCHSVGNDVPRVLLRLPWAAFLRFQGKTWVGCWVNRSSTCVLRVWSYSRFSAALERNVAEYLEQCLRSTVKMHWKRWKQLLIFVSSARGGEAAVCSAGKNMSSLSSVTHQLKKWNFFQDFLFLLAEPILTW